MNAQRSVENCSIYIAKVMRDEEIFAQTVQIAHLYYNKQFYSTHLNKFVCSTNMIGGATQQPSENT